jgi:hypothetical protein
VHVDEYFAEPAILVLAGTQIDLMEADHRLLLVALAAVGQPPMLAALRRRPILDSRSAA